MATSLQCRHAAVLVVATLAVLFIGSADSACPPGFKDCNPYRPGCETCIKTDVHNCGDCGKKCKLNLPYTTAKCVDFKCVYTCKVGYADCDNQKYSNGCETNLRKDSKNCGKCGEECKQLPKAITKCSNFYCQDPYCKAGWGNCDGDVWSNGCEINLNKNINHCGRCWFFCRVTLLGGEATCKNGQCGQQCPEGTYHDVENNCCTLRRPAELP